MKIKHIIIHPYYQKLILTVLLAVNIKIINYRTFKKFEIIMIIEEENNIIGDSIAITSLYIIFIYLVRCVQIKFFN